MQGNSLIRDSKYKFISQLFSGFKFNIDWWFLLAILPISIFGILTMSSLTLGDVYLRHQGLWVMVGVGIFVIMSSLDFSFLKSTKIVMTMYVLINLLLATTLILGNLVKGSKAWLSLGGISIQPVDFAKIVLIILLAKYFSKRHMEIQHMRHIIVSFIYAMIPITLVMLQPDFGSAMVLFGIWFIMLLLSGLSRKHFLMMTALGMVTVVILWTSVFKIYQKDRILNFLDPKRDIRGSGYNVYQSQIAIGSGGLLGKGVGFGTQSRLNFLPEHETDFIFAGFAEEWGFVGVFILLSLLAIICMRILYVSYTGRDNFDTLLGGGVFAWFLIHITINIGMNLGLLPVTGIPLPFMSYGGSHFLAECIALGFVSSSFLHRTAGRRHYKNEFLGLE